MKRPSRLLCPSLCLALALQLAAPGIAAAAAPVTTLSLDPASPDGSGGWWRVPPEAYARVDQDAELSWAWSGEELRSASVTGGVSTPLGAAPEGIRFLQARATSAQGAGETETVVVKTDSMEPPRPATLEVSFAAAGVALGWPASLDEAPGSGVAAYTVYRNLSGWPFQPSDQIAVTTLPGYLDPNGYGPYVYAVRAVDAAGNTSLFSDTAATPPDVTPPSAPGGVSAWRNGMPAVHVAWTASSDTGSGVLRYVMTRVVDGGASQTVATLGPDQTVVDDTDPGVYAASEITYTVTAEDRMGNVASAFVASVTTDTAAPTVPAGLASALVPGAVELTWEASADATSGIAGYRVFRNVTGPPFDEADLLAFVTSTSFQDSDAFDGDYQYAVCAVDGAGNASEPSGPVDGWTDPFPPLAPGDLRAWRGAQPLTRLVWRPSVDAETGVHTYVVKRSIGGAASVELATLGPSATSFDDADAGAYAESDVVYEVVARDWAFNTSAATAMPQTDLAPPQVPTGLGYSVTPASLRLTWNAAADASSGVARYRVYRSLTTAPFSWEVMGETTGTVFEDSTAHTGLTWYYAVSALDAVANESGLSDPLLAWVEYAPPSAPGSPEAWRNASRVTRILWTPATDAGSGLARYVVRRSISGATPVEIASLPASATSFEDTSGEAYDAVDVVYSIVAVDRAGNAATATVSPVTDVTPPWAVMPLVRAEARLAGREAADYVAGYRVQCAAPAETGSGLLRYELMYGPDPAAPAVKKALMQAESGDVVIANLGPGVTWYFRVRAEDRAGNVATSPAAGLHAAWVDRAAGPDRVRTSLAVSRAAFASSRSVVFANAFNFPDALAASGLAGALRAPIVLVGPGPLPADTLAELDRLGARDGWVIGGEPAVSAATFASIRASLPGSVERVAGADRYATAAAVAAEVKRLRGAPSRVFLVSGENFPDALSAGPAAYVSASPVVFARSTSLPAVTASALKDAGAPQTVILGSSVAVHSGVERLVSGPVRVAGPTRYGTSVAFARWARDNGILGGSAPLLATGLGFPDGLSAASLGGERRSPVLLVQSGLGEAGAYLTGSATDVSRVTAIGSGVVVPEAALLDAWQRLQVASVAP